MKRNVFSPTAFALALLLGCGTEQPSREQTSHSRTDLVSLARGPARFGLTQSQCEYFLEHGKTQICHHTGSATKPYVIVKLSEQACIHAHANHPEDYVAAADDPTCQGLGCLPVNAPCDETVGCCDGLTCESGVCTCVPTSCAAAEATCGTIADGCGGTLDCGPCITCPCESQAGWGTTPVDSCVYSTSIELSGVIIDGEVSVSGGAYAAMKTADEHFCVVQFPTGAFSQYTTISAAEYEVCRAQVQTVMQANQLQTCELWHVDRCYPSSCEDQEVHCGTVDDGCGNTLDCGPCDP